MKHPHFRIPDSAQKVIDIYESFEWQQVVQMPVTQTSLDSSNIQIYGKDAISFGSCSYLGLHKDERIIEAGIKAVRENGTIYSSSRSFTYIDLVDEFDDALTQVFGAPTIASMKTTLADLSAIPTLVLPEDIVLIDQQAHATLQSIVLIPKAMGTVVDRIMHNDLNHLETKIKYYSKSCKGKIWFFCDGIYSMYGDAAPITEIISLLDKYDNLYLYIDDAHGMSWTGPNGAGYVSKYLPLGHPKVVMVTSLGKGFGIGGGALICPNEKIRGWLKKVGLTNVFCTQLPNYMLGSGIESAKIHLTNEIYTLQDTLKTNIEFFVETCRKQDVLVHNYSETPIFYMLLGSHYIAIELNMRLRKKGFYGNLGIYPAVSHKNSGIRISITSDHSKNEIENLISTYSTVLLEILEENGLTLNHFKESILNGKGIEELIS
jgi:7-keto-8-aminopelargonate synthetase-like enzyme